MSSPAAPERRQQAKQSTGTSALQPLGAPASILSPTPSSQASSRLHCTPAGSSSDDTEPVRAKQTGRSEMESRRQSSGGSSATACAAAAGEGNTHSGSGGGGCNNNNNKLDRKDVEKNRRLHMKSLCLKLSSLLPPASLLADAAAAAAAASPNKQDTVTQLDQLDSAAAYIKQLKGRIEALKQRKAGGAAGGGAVTAASSAAGSGGGGGVRMPVVEVRYQDGTLDVVLISDAGRTFKLHQVITVLEQEGAEVVSASFSVIGDRIFYTIHSQALSPLTVTGLDAARVSQRLHDLLLLASPCLIGELNLS